MRHFVTFLLSIVLLAHVARAQPNVVALTAETPITGFNRLTVSVTLCAPGGARCATIDHIMVDTGSVGLRLQPGTVPPGLGLPLARDGDGRAMAECLHFTGNAAWGGLYRADVRLGGMEARDIPVQLVGDELKRPESCPAGAHPTSNGTLGIGMRATDCDGSCIQSATHPRYFVCTPSGCAAAAGSVPDSLRLPNPVRRFASNSNGVVFDMPMPARRGVPSVRGRLIFGVGTSSDNTPGAAQPIRLGPDLRFRTLYGGVEHADSYFDSGTQYMIVPDPALPHCEDSRYAVCQSPTRRLGATLIGADGARLDLPFLAGTYPAASERGVFASAVQTAAPGHEDLFVWGFPFFLGRRVYLVYRDATVPGRPDLDGPLYAIASP